MYWIKTKEQARQYAINYQNWISERTLGYRQLLEFQDELYDVAEKFGLVEEFKENGIL